MKNIFKSILILALDIGSCIATEPMILEDQEKAGAAVKANLPTIDLTQPEPATAGQILLTLGNSSLPTEIIQHIFSYLDDATAFHLWQTQLTYKAMTADGLAKLPSDQQTVFKALEGLLTLPNIATGWERNIVYFHTNRINREKFSKIDEMPLGQVLEKSLPDLAFYISPFLLSTMLPIAQTLSETQ